MQEKPKWFFPAAAKQLDSQHTAGLGARHFNTNVHLTSFGLKQTSVWHSNDKTKRGTWLYGCSRPAPTAEPAKSASLLSPCDCALLQSGTAKPIKCRQEVHSRGQSTYILISSTQAGRFLGTMDLLGCLLYGYFLGTILQCVSWLVGLLPKVTEKEI